MRKVYLVVCIVTLITCLTGLSYLFIGIAERGLDGVNYGRVLFPLLIGAISFKLYKTQS